MSKKLAFKLRIWRQNGPNANGYLKDYDVKDVAPEQSFLEMLDVLNQELIRRIKAVKALDARVRHTRLKPQTIRPQADRYSHGLALDRSPRRPRTPRQWSLASHRSAVRSSPRASAWACGWSRG